MRREMRYWLMKSEPDAYSWDDLNAEGEGTWDGVRNHRAKNNLAAMEVGDQAFFYHSNCPEPGIAGIVERTDAGFIPTGPDLGAWGEGGAALRGASPALGEAEVESAGAAAGRL